MPLLSGWGTQAWGVDSSSSGGGSPPIVSNILPTPGTLLHSTTLVSFDVTDSDSAIRKTVIWVSYPNKVEREVVFDGVDIMPQFFPGSVRVSISNGFRYTLIRAGGWPDVGISITVMAIDTTGNED